MILHFFQKFQQIIDDVEGQYDDTLSKIFDVILSAKNYKQLNEQTEGYKEEETELAIDLNKLPPKCLSKIKGFIKSCRISTRN